MKIQHMLYSRLSILFQSAFIMAWLSNLALSDSIFFIYTFCAVFGIFCICENQKKQVVLSKGDTLSSLVIAFLFSCMTILANYRLFTPLSDLLILFNFVCSIFGGTILAFHVLICFLARIPLRKKFLCSDITAKNGISVFTFVFCSIVCINLIHLFFVEYPGNLVTDSFNQLNQILSGQYTNHHPFWHTVIIQFFFTIGVALFQDYNAAVALYAVWQILFMAACFAYAVVTLYQCNIPRRWVYGVWAVFALMPYNIAFSISMGKDVIFSGAVLAFLCAFYRCLKCIGRKPIMNYIWLFFSGVAVCVWRSNGIIAFTVSLLFFIPFLWRNKRIMLILMSGALVCGWVMTNPVLSSMNIQQPDLVESLSIPVQQVTRVVYDGCELTDEQYALIDTVVDIDQIPQLYCDWISDPMKDEIRSKNNSYFEENAGEYLKLWIDLGLQYPWEYVKAWVDQTKGYWNGGYDYFVYSLGVTNNDLGITEGANDNLIALISHAIFKLCRGAIFMAPFESIGLNVWLLFILFFVNWRKKRKEMLLSVPGLALILTLLIATPVYAVFRYAYPVFTTLPFILAVSLCDVENV